MTPPSQPRRHPYHAILERVPRQGVTLESGTVTAVGSGRVTVTWAGASIPNVPYIGAAPAVDDRVWMLHQGTTLLVIGVA